MGVEEVVDVAVVVKDFAAIQSLVFFFCNSRIVKDLFCSETWVS